MFRILIVDDDQAGTFLLRGLMQNLQLQYKLYFTRDGLEALDLLHRRGDYAGSPRPHLILLDMNMPRLGGLETLSAIKSDPELCVIPVIMLSSASPPHEVRRSYEAHAACYVQKPVDLERSAKLVKAIEDFWMDFAVLSGGEPAPDDGKSIESKDGSTIQTAQTGFGSAIANGSVEVRSQATMSSNDSPAKNEATPANRNGCKEHNRLLDEFGAAVRELLELHEQQFHAIVAGESECERFDILIHMANEKKQLAKYVYLRHLEQHSCSKI